jgi:hypothetical protein
LNTLFERLRRKLNQLHELNLLRRELLLELEGLGLA